MASPVDAGRTSTSISSAADPWTVDLPSGVQSLDLLIIYLRTGGATSCNGATGWTFLVDDNTSDATDDQTSILYKFANGTEGTTVSVDFTGTTKGASIAWRITGAENPAVQVPEISTVATSTTTANTCDPGTVTPTGGSKDYLFLITGGLDGETQTFTHGTYTNVTNQNSGTGGAVATNCRIAGGSRQATVSSENPSAWTHAAASNGTTAYTIAIHPASAAVELPYLSMPPLAPFEQKMRRW